MGNHQLYDFHGSPRSYNRNLSNEFAEAMPKQWRSYFSDRAIRWLPRFSSLNFRYLLNDIFVEHDVDGGSIEYTVHRMHSF